MVVLCCGVGVWPQGNTVLADAGTNADGNDRPHAAHQRLPLRSCGEGASRWILPLLSSTPPSLFPRPPVPKIGLRLPPTQLSP